MLTQTLQIRDFQGLNTDLPREDLPPNVITGGNNFRVRGGGMETYGGSTLVHQIEDIADPSHIHFVDAGISNYWVVAGSDALSAWDGLDWYPLQIGLNVNAKLWTSTDLGRVPVFNNPGTYPLYWAPAALNETLKLLPWDADNTWQDRGCRALSIRAYKQLLVAVGYAEAGQDMSDVVVWSQPADSGAVPPSWDYFDPATRAGHVVLGGDGGECIDALPLRDAMCVYRHQGITLMEYTPSDWVFTLRDLTTTLTLAGTNCVQEIKGMHLVAGADDVVINDGNQVKSLMHNRVRKHYQQVFEAAGHLDAFTTRNDIAKEIWVVIPENGGVGNRKAFVWNWVDDSWAVRDVGINHHSEWGQYEAAGGTWDSVTKTWDEMVGTWDQGINTVFNRKLLGIVDDELHTFDATGDGISTGPYTTYWQRDSISPLGPGISTTIQRIIPQMEGSIGLSRPDITIQVGSRQRAGGPIRWKPPMPFNPREQRTLDMRTTGEFHSFVVSTKGVSTLKFTGLDIEYVESGRQ